MTKTLKEIREKIHTSKRDQQKPRGSVTRDDILDILEHYSNPETKKQDVERFFKTLDLDVITEEDKEKILSDLDSYKEFKND